jgi:acyl-CoA thioesterase-1
MHVLDSLDPIIFFVGSGLAFFVGVACILVGLTASLVESGRAVSLARNLAVLVGGILVAISAAPLEWWGYVLVASVTGIWLPFEWCKRLLPRSAIVAARVAVLAVWLLALGLEVPYHVTPSLPPLARPALLVIGVGLVAVALLARANFASRKA